MQRVLYYCHGCTGRVTQQKCVGVMNESFPKMCVVTIDWTEDHHYRLLQLDGDHNIP
jgi:hypothetical protein